MADGGGGGGGGLEKVINTETEYVTVTSFISPIRNMHMTTNKNNFILKKNIALAFIKFKFFKTIALKII